MVLIVTLALVLGGVMATRVLRGSETAEQAPDTSAAPPGRESVTGYLSLLHGITLTGSIFIWELFDETEDNRPMAVEFGEGVMLAGGGRDCLIHRRVTITGIRDGQRIFAESVRLAPGEAPSEPTLYTLAGLRC